MFSLPDLRHFADSSALSLPNLARDDFDNGSECLHLLLHGTTLYTVPEARTITNVACTACLPCKQLRQTLREVECVCDRVDWCAQWLGRVVAVGQRVDEGSERCSLGAVFRRCRCDEEENGSCVDCELYVELGMWVGR